MTGTPLLSENSHYTTLLSLKTYLRTVTSLPQKQKSSSDFFWLAKTGTNVSLSDKPSGVILQTFGKQGILCLAYEKFHKNSLLDSGGNLYKYIDKLYRTESLEIVAHLWSQLLY